MLVHREDSDLCGVLYRQGLFLADWLRV